MVYVVDPQAPHGGERRLTPAEFDRRRSETDVYVSEYDRTRDFTLRDCVDGTLLRVGEPAAVTRYLRKLIWRCSACTFTTIVDRQVEQHIAGEMMRTKSHARARMKQVEVNGHGLCRRCTGCGTTFSLSIGDGEAHLASARKTAEMHRDAKGIFMRRYAMAGEKQ